MINLEEVVISCLNNDNCYNNLVLSEIAKMDIPSYKKNTVIRLLKSVKKWRDDLVTDCDMLKTLRNYLLEFGVTVEADTYICDMVKKANNKFGLRMEGESHIYAVLDTPEYVNKKFVSDAYGYGGNMQTSIMTNTQYFLGTNPYIYNLTHFKFFKSIEQKLAVIGALNTPEGFTTLISLPTGGGKSLVTQTLAYQNDKSLTVAIVPTVSLALDQVRAATNNINHDVSNEIFCYFSGMENEIIESMLKSIKSETAKLIFISPEAIIKNKKISKALEEANEKKYLKNIIIDEAHILIEWGAFFRIDYQFLEVWRKNLMISNRTIRTILLSATFERKTIDNLKLMFSDDTWLEIRCDSLRREPRYLYVEAKSFSDKKHKFLELVEKMPHPMIVYVTSPDKADYYKKVLMDNGYKNIETFTGKTNSKDRERLINWWAENEFDIMIATSAFGVGVDKDDVRTVLHMYIPENPNKYYQELGRGGRDGLPCLSIMCVYPDEDLQAAFNMTDKVLSSEKIQGRWFSMIGSPLSERNEGTILIDTSIKPTYNIEENEIFMEETMDVNKINMQWNIYVILLLRRYNVINILDMIYEATKQKYYLKIQIENYDLLFDNNKCKILITKIREEEKTKFESDFLMMRLTINNHRKYCWSEMFCSTYELVSEFCAGCATHDNIIYTDKNKFPLLLKLDNIKIRTTYVDTLLNETTEALVIGDKNDIEAINTLILRGVNILVIDKTMETEENFLDLLLRLPQMANISIIGIKELVDLVSKQDWYYLSGVVMMMYGLNDEGTHYKMILLSKKLEQSGHSKVIHLVKNNEYIKEMGKNIFELIEGPCFESYMLKELEE